MENILKNFTGYSDTNSFIGKKVDNFGLNSVLIGKCFKVLKKDCMCNEFAIRIVTEVLYPHI